MTAESEAHRPDRRISQAAYPGLDKRIEPHGGLTREQIEAWKTKGAKNAAFRTLLHESSWHALCNMALRSLAPQASPDGSKPCCGEWETCQKPCCPRGTHQATKRLEGFVAKAAACLPAEHAKTLLDAFWRLMDGHPQASDGQGAAQTFCNGHNALNLVDSLLAQAGYQPDSSARHNLAIAKSCFNAGERQSDSHPSPQSAAGAEAVAWLHRDGKSSLTAAEWKHHDNPTWRHVLDEEWRDATPLSARLNAPVPDVEAQVFLATRCDDDGYGECVEADLARTLGRRLKEATENAQAATDIARTEEEIGDRERLRAEAAESALAEAAAVELPDIETVSARVHAAWMESKHRQGVKSRRAEDGEELMIPYEELSEKAKQLDRGSVEAVYAAIRGSEREGGGNG